MMVSFFADLTGRSNDLFDLNYFELFNEKYIKISFNFSKIANQKRVHPVQNYDN